MNSRKPVAVTSRQLHEMASELAFFASELAAVASDMDGKQVASLEVLSWKTMRLGVEKLRPGVARMRQTLFTAMVQRGHAALASGLAIVDATGRPATLADAEAADAAVVDQVVAGSATPVAARGGKKHRRARG